MKLFREADDIDWGVAILPKGKIRASALLVQGYAIPQYSRYSQEAWELIKFLIGKKSQMMTAGLNWGLPSLKSLCQTEPEQDVFLDELSYAHPLQALSIESYLLLNRELAFLWANMQTAKETGRNINRAVNLLDEGKK